MLRVAAVVLVALFVTSGTAAAQGRGGGGGKGRSAPASAARGGSQTSTAPVALQPSPSFPQLGIWLDDATIVGTGEGYASLGAAYWRSSNANQIDVPIVGITYGISNCAQLSASVPFYRASYGGLTASGLDNVYVNGKVALVSRDAGAGGIGVALGAVAEILSAGLAEASRVHWVVPVSVEVRAHPVRMYGSTGYFSRGAFFAAAAVEVTVPAGTSVTASLAHSASVRGLTIATSPGTTPRGALRDATVVVAHPVSDAASVYASGSRTFSATRINGASSVNVGLSFRFVGP